LQTRALPIGHILKKFQRAGQGSNLPFPDLEAGVPPMEQPARELSSRSGEQ
jgi:hypothetical protein